ncbi:MAG: mechanosensitive ion channel, partial [Atopostipes suicloacalis]|nr:mechanosensitive ion channel [Atopostipes suicloacalis]
LFTFGETEISVFLLLTLIFAVFLAFKLSQMIQEFVLPIFYDRYEVDIGSQASINTFSKYFVITLTVLIVLSSIGFDLTSLTVLASVLGVGIGFGLKNVMSNFISGLIILFERPIKVGDRVIVDGTIATVEEIKIRATVVRTRKNERLIIPNAFFLENEFTNRSFNTKKLRVSVNVDVAYGSDVEKVEKLLLECVHELKEEKWSNILEAPKARVFFEEFGDSGLAFSVWFWINSQSNEREFIIPSDLRFKITKKFREHNIEIPFPQQDVHLHKND